MSSPTPGKPDATTCVPTHSRPSSPNGADPNAESAPYQPLHREPRTFGELIPWAAHWAASARSGFTLPAPVTATDPDHGYLEFYCRDEFGEMSLDAIGKLRARYAKQTGKTVHQIEVTTLRELADHFRGLNVRGEGGVPGTVIASHAVPGNSEGEKPPADSFAELREFARDKLKLKERAVIEALCKSGGRLRIADLAVMEGVKWEDPFRGFKDVQSRLNKVKNGKPLKLKTIGWMLSRNNNGAVLINFKVRKRR